MRTKKFAFIVAALATVCLVGVAFADDPPILGGEGNGNSLTSPVLSVQTFKSTASLGWTSVPGASGYTLSYAPYPYTGPDSIKHMDVGTKRGVAVDLSVGSSYYVAVQAYNNSGSSAYSNIERFTIFGVSCVVSTDDEGTVAVASVGDENADIDNALVTVNDVALAYGPSLEFRTERGFDVDVVLPIYYADLSRFTYGDSLQLTARMPDGTIIYDRTNVTIPGRLALLEPNKCQIIADSQDVPMQWDVAADAEGYVAGYTEVDAFDQDLADDDAGYYAAYVDASTTEATVPSAYTVIGDATFFASAVTGDTEIFTSEEDAVGSFLIATTSDSVDAKIVEAFGSESLPVEKVTEDRGSQGLRVAKQYSKKIEGYKFNIRECDPNQIQSPGTISFYFKLHSYKASIAFVEAYDMNGNKYFSWKKVRIFKSSKKYYPSFSVSPGTTVIFGTHDASERGKTYSY
ncbi:MAG: fibronectin type III domain-containing protein [Deltaproteobacteria bacterium]|nr:fibronectin type III domain-containing protein [Deltaproteobacteria bacterium]